MFIEAATVGEAITVVHGTLFAYENRDKMRPFLRKIRHRIRHGKTSIAIFGSGGTGKTTLGRLLSGPPSRRQAPQPYITSIGLETYPLHSDHVFCVLLVAPGQEALREHTWPELRNRLSAGKTHIVINVVSWGYHHFEPDSYQRSPHFRQGDSAEEFMQRYVEARREEELNALREMTPCLKDTDGNLRMITLVTKQDLWWNRRDDVRDYYMHGPYHLLIAEIQYVKGARLFRHEYLSASLTVQNMLTAPGELLAQTSAGYDETIYLANLDKLLSMIAEMTTR